MSLNFSHFSGTLGFVSASPFLLNQQKTWPHLLYALLCILYSVLLFLAFVKCSQDVDEAIANKKNFLRNMRKKRKRVKQPGEPKKQLDLGYSLNTAGRFHNFPLNFGQLLDLFYPPCVFLRVTCRLCVVCKGHI